MFAVLSSFDNQQWMYIIFVCIISAIIGMFAQYYLYEPYVLKIKH